jgi:Zn-dependent peptidase ImmA (M78 family)/transcriptional regulator with XRE-family HTH domain
MTSQLDNISSSEVGERLRMARDAANFTQASAAEAVDMSRTTLVAIEQGQRRIRMDELQKLAKLYGTSVNGLLRSEAVHVDLAPKFRKMIGQRDNAGQKASQLLTNLAKAEVELENLIGVHRTRNYPPERPLITPAHVLSQAEQDALELRQRLGLGMSPVLDIVTLLEFEMGVRVYVRKLDPHISGLFAYDERLGACILLNAGHPRERRTLTAAHELGHLVSTRRSPDVVHDDSPERTPEERYCNSFARNFVMPARILMHKFKEVTAGASRLTRRHVIILAHVFGASREAMVRRLEELRLTKPGTWDWFEENGRISDAQAREVLGDLVYSDSASIEAERPTTLRLNLLAEEAWRKNLLSEGQLASLLQVERVELRKLIDGVRNEGSMVDEAPMLPL